MFYKDIQGKQSRSGQLKKWNVVEILNYYAPDIMNDGKYSLINSQGRIYFKLALRPYIHSRLNIFFGLAIHLMLHSALWLNGSADRFSLMVC